MLNIKKILIYALVICMLIPTMGNVNALAVEDSIVDIFTDGVFCITEDRMFVDLTKLVDALSDPIGFSDAYADALGKIITSDEEKINDYKLTSFAVVGFARFMNDNDFSIDELKDYLDDKDKAGFRSKIEGKADDLSLALQNAGVDEEEQSSLTSGFAQMNSIFNKIAMLDMFESAISDHEFYMATSKYGDFELDSSKASNFVAQLYGDEVASDAVNAMEDFVDYYNDTRKSDKKLIYKHLDEYDFINLDTSGETVETPGNSGGGLSPSTPVEEPVPRVKFNDVDADYWAKDYIEILAGKGIINGKGNNLFNPYDDITRAEFVALITRMLNIVKTDEIIPFTDIETTEWYADEILAAYQTGLINGKSNNTFAPNAPITRQEASIVITNALKYLGYNIEQDAKLIDNTFKDDSSIASWAKNAVATTYREEIINGKPNDLFDPTGNTTRAEVAKMIYVLFKK